MWLLNVSLQLHFVLRFRRLMLAKKSGAALIMLQLQPHLPPGWWAFRGKRSSSEKQNTAVLLPSNPLPFVLSSFPPLPFSSFNSHFSHYRSLSLSLSLLPLTPISLLPLAFLPLSFYPNPSSYLPPLLTPPHLSILLATHPTPFSLFLCFSSPS